MKEAKSGEHPGGDGAGVQFRAEWWERPHLSNQ